MGHLAGGQPAGKEHLETRPAPRAAEPDGGRLLEMDGDGSPMSAELRVGRSEPRALIEIPADIDSLERERPGQAARWRQATRSAFGAALASGFLVEDFVRASRGPRAVGVYVEP